VKIIKEEAEPDPNTMGMQGGVPGGVAGGSMGGVLGGVIGGVAGPPPPKPTQSRIRQGGAVTAASLINKVNPVYPPLAADACGWTVRLHAIISKQGTVQQLEVLSGHPLLVQSALDAVRQWRYRPTLLNGEPVEVDTTIGRHFLSSFVGTQQTVRRAVRGTSAAD